jgi:hypothetical protein
MKKPEKFQLTVEVDEIEKRVVIKDSRDPIDKEFSGGVHIVAADADTKVYYALAWGASADLGWALAQSFNDGWNLPFMRRLFVYFTEWINNFFVNDGAGYDLKELEEKAEKWEEEDKTKYH